MFSITEHGTIALNFCPAAHREERTIKLWTVPDVLNGDNVNLL